MIKKPIAIENHPGDIFLFTYLRQSNADLLRRSTPLLLFVRSSKSFDNVDTDANVLPWSSEITWA